MSYSVFLEMSSLFLFSWLHCAVIESIYLLIFIIYATKKEKAKTFRLLMFALSVLAAVALVSLLALHGNTRKIFCGVASAIFSIIMYASPLSSLYSGPKRIWVWAGSHVPQQGYTKETRSSIEWVGRDDINRINQ
ncbi:hypothetical protein Ddye_027850 [Dipteronia dyeriana]|uniref:Uncharacterized protein n=1 Tax=Dipteronia dyeriana TaxID=168575 RepID=A0AAD9TPX1_9ROSI|nr:hypothetical protein Ddye_027850 [Dipteronia dyeriana]